MDEGSGLKPEVKLRVSVICRSAPPSEAGVKGVVWVPATLHLGPWPSPPSLQESTKSDIQQVKNGVGPSTVEDIFQL